jgi:hypothetical protein
MRKLLLVLLLLHLTFSGSAQESLAEVNGVLVDEQGEGLANVQIRIPRLKQLIFSGAEGRFHLTSMPFGSYTLILTRHDLSDTLRIFIDSSIVYLGSLTVNMLPFPARQTDETAIASEGSEGSSVSDEDDRNTRVSSMLNAGRDAFQNTVAYTFGAYRFHARGYKTNQQQVYINGISMNDIETGDAYWSLWGGLNDAFRKKSNSYGLFLSEYGIGSLNGSVALDATAASQRKQTKLTWSLSNRSYRNRIMLTHNSGLLRSGWAYSLSFSKRWSGEGYVDGTFYDGYSYYAAASKLINKHTISLTAFGALSKRGKAAPVTGEVTSLTASTTYNPNWGYQNGKKRNAKIADYSQPVFLLNYDFHPSDRLTWNTTIGYQFGRNANSTLDWYNASDPRPDYYRYLPSWQLLLFKDDPALAALRAQTLTEQWQNDPTKRQIDWGRLYNVNYSNVQTIYNIDGNPADSITGRRSLYVQSDEIDAIRKFSFNTRLQKICSDHLTLYTGLSYASQHTESFRQLKDLLGGEFFVDINQFAERAYPGNITMGQNDLDHPNRIIHSGDKYAYDYISSFTDFSCWGQAALSFNHLDLFVAASLGTSSFSREGLYRNGLYQNDSKGKGATLRFNNWYFKGGITYKINGRNYIFLNGSAARDAPLFDHTYVSPRNRNLTIDQPIEQKIYAVEAGYLLRAPKLNGRLVAYVTDMKDAAEIRRFYSDDDRFQSFVNYALQHIDMRFTGIELALDAKLSTYLNITGVASIGQAFYTNRPKVSVYKDNDTTSIVVPRSVFVKDFYLGVGPQSAYSLAFNFHSRQYWYATVSLNYFDRNYIDIAPDRRSQEAADAVAPSSAQYHELFDQERLPSFFTVDLFAGKSFLLSRTFRFLPRSFYCYLNIGVNNLMDKKDIRTGGFEQLRYDFKTNSPGTFPAKYFYGAGRNYFLNLSFKI